MLATLSSAMLVAVACAGRTGVDPGAGGTASGGSGGNAAAGQGGVGAVGGSACQTAEGVRLCGGEHGECSWLDADACPGGGCAAPYDRQREGNAVAGVCFSDLPDQAMRPCPFCDDGEVCLERKPGQLFCVPEGVCARLWLLGARGVCRYADLARYDARPLPVLDHCPPDGPNTTFCGGACTKQCSLNGAAPCVGRSPDHPQGFCSFEGADDWCALDDKGYVNDCRDNEYCGVFRHGDADDAVAKLHGRCLWTPSCLELSSALPGGFDCYDDKAKLVAK